MNNETFSLSMICIILAPVVLSMVSFTRRIYSVLDSKYLPGIFVVRIACALSFLFPVFSYSDLRPIESYFQFSSFMELWFVIFILCCTVILLARRNARTPSNQKIYPQLRTEQWTPWLVCANAVTWTVYLFGYEYFFRGFLLNVPFVSWPVYDVVIISVILYAVAHALKGWKEFLLSVPFGFLLCYLTLESGSIWPAFIIHTSLAISNDWYGIQYQRKQKRDFTSEGKIQPYVLVTGASAGIGKALATEFAKLKKNLLLVSLPDSGLEAVAAQIRSDFGVNVNTLCLDLTESTAPSEILNWCRENSFYTDTLVNNAGFGNLNAFDRTHSAVVESMMVLNNSALVKLTHLFIPELKKFRQSYILNVGSLASFMPIPGKSLYAATKSFVYTFSQSLYYELTSYNIQVSCLCPGGTLTERVQNAMAQQGLNRTNFCQHPDDVARAGVKGMYNKRFRIIPGLHNRFLYGLSQALPDNIKILIIRLAFNTRQKKVSYSVRSMSPMRSFALVSR